MVQCILAKLLCLNDCCFQSFFAVVETWQKRINAEREEYVIWCPEALSLVFLALFRIYVNTDNLSSVFS